MKNNLIISLLLCFVGFACATESINVETPHRVSQNKVNSITVGKTTKAEIAEMFGDPETKVPTSEGEIWFMKDLSLSSVWILFNHKGVVLETEYSQ